LISKTDLLPHFDFSLDEAKKEATALNPELKIFEVSVKSDNDLDGWISHLRQLAGK
jgi:hydrogenase nickel incorporation protein HypB